ncbi:hypothetical protein Skr01_75590 [Sphaerisporangium krabiense]|uniref:Uncharacterized protein n=1 Tax=Sphaerisporangium krabiense TaxID=763782 RepID=A0A7W9DP65_9ACTN|nr:hypothetical protein [Sphaerisporangium krabiense]MBB5626122.1 hypothetical protein [Sphaerisporangium krabiense]GII67474.1 hypothetical protein Skr01_75590 [Sphaerisporangium krabiense]
MIDQHTWLKNADDALVSAIGGVTGAVADPKGGLRRLRSSLVSPRTSVLGAGIALAYVLGRRRAHRAAARRPGPAERAGERISGGRA